MLAIACVSGCGSEPNAERTAGPRPGGVDPVPLPVLQVGPDIALDVRLVSLFPDRHVGQEALCDLSYVGQLTNLSVAERAELDFPAGQRVTVRCAAPTGSGWATLVLSPDAAGLAPYVVVGKRIRVHVRGAGTAAQPYPLLEFVAVVEDAPSYPESDGSFAPVPAGFDFGRLRRAPERVGTRATCAILHVGPTRPIDPALEPRYPTGATHHAVLACQSAREASWIDLALTPETLLGALRLERGVLLPVRIEARRGGYTDLPVVSYVLR